PPAVVTVSALLPLDAPTVAAPGWVTDCVLYVPAAVLGSLSADTEDAACSPACVVVPPTTSEPPARWALLSTWVTCSCWTSALWERRSTLVESNVSPDTIPVVSRLPELMFPTPWKKG